MVRKFVKAAGALLAAVIVFLVIVANFGTHDTRIMCSGEVRRTVDGGKHVTPATLYGLVEAYRWFIVWADHDAMIAWEIQPGGDTGFGYFSESNFGTPIVDLYRTKTYGAFSSLSGRISVETALDGREVFDGQCK